MTKKQELQKILDDSAGDLLYAQTKGAGFLKKGDARDRDEVLILASLTQSRALLVIAQTLVLNMKECRDL